MKRVTILLAPAAQNRAKLLAQARGVTLSELVQEGLERLWSEEYPEEDSFFQISLNPVKGRKYRSSELDDFIYGPSRRSKR